MARMQVTFTNVAQQSFANPGFASHLSTLMFQIEYRGKRYDCVGHLRDGDQSEDSSRSKVKFSGYYGYNGPIDIQKLRDAAIDYYRTMTGIPEHELQLVESESSRHSKSGTRTAGKPVSMNKSYDFNVGGQDQMAFQKAS